jgi:hypothetical protein
MAVPAIAAALTVVALEAWRARAPEAPLFATPFAYSMAEAIERDDVARAFAYIRAGQDTNTPIPVRHPTLTDDRQVLLAPILWAVTADARQSVRMLLGYGARFDPATEHAAVCIARAFESESMIELLDRIHPAHPAEPCPAVRGRGEMVLAFAATP